MLEDHARSPQMQLRYWSAPKGLYHTATEEISDLGISHGNELLSHSEIFLAHPLWATTDRNGRKATPLAGSYVRLTRS